MVSHNEQQVALSRVMKSIADAQAMIGHGEYSNVSKLFERYDADSDLTTIETQPTNPSPSPLRGKIRALQSLAAFLQELQKHSKELAEAKNSQSTMIESQTSSSHPDLQKLTGLTQLIATKTSSINDIEQSFLKSEAAKDSEIAYLWALSRLTIYYDADFATGSVERKEKLSDHVLAIIDQAKYLKSEGKEDVAKLTRALTLTYQLLTAPNPDTQQNYQEFAITMASQHSRGVRALGISLLILGVVVLCAGLLIMPPVTAVAVGIVAGLVAAGTITAAGGGLTLFAANRRSGLAGSMSKVLDNHRVGLPADKEQDDAAGADADAAPKPS